MHSTGSTTDTSGFTGFTGGICIFPIDIAGIPIVSYTITT